MEYARLGDIYEFQYGTGNNNPDNGGVYPVYGSNGIIGGYHKYNSEDAPVIGHIGANCGSVVWGKGKHYVTYNGVICNIKEGNDAKFGYYSLLVSNLKARSVGSAQPFISYNLLNRVPIYLPSLPTQQKIASILSTYDTLIENNTKRIRLLEQMAENLYREWFVRFRFPGHENVEMENGLPKGWKVERIKECVKRLPYGRTYKENELSQEGSVIVIDQSTSELLGYHNNAPSHYASFDSPIILFGDHSCKFCFMTRNFSLGENVIPFISKDANEIDICFLYFATHKLIVTEEYKRHWGRFSAMKILIPQIELQQKFSKLVIEFEKLKQSLIAANSLLTRQRDLLLPRLMSGKLEVTV